MALEIDLKLDRRNLAKFRTLLKANRTMAAKSLTFTAEKAKPAWIAGHNAFHKRNTWIDKGVRIRPATAGTLTAKVGTLDKYMGRHVKGIGERKRGRLFVPAYGAISEAPKHTRVRSNMKRAKATQRKPFIVRFKSGKAAVVRRKGKKRTPLIVMGYLTQGADITPQLDAMGIVNRTVQREFPRIYERLLLAWAAKG